MSNNSLSNDDTVHNAHSIIPVTSDQEPIKWDDNVAHIKGVLFELNRWLTTTGRFQELLSNGSKSARGRVKDEGRRRLSVYIGRRRYIEIGGR